VLLSLVRASDQILCDYKQTLLVYRVFRAHSVHELAAALLLPAIRPCMPIHGRRRPYVSSLHHQPYVLLQRTTYYLYHVLWRAATWPHAGRMSTKHVRSTVASCTLCACRRRRAVHCARVHACTAGGAEKRRVQAEAQQWNQIVCCLGWRAGIS
jgi:hypothetical protein